MPHRLEARLEFQPCAAEWCLRKHIFDCWHLVLSRLSPSEGISNGTQRLHADHQVELPAQGMNSAEQVYMELSLPPPQSMSDSATISTTFTTQTLRRHLVLPSRLGLSGKHAARICDSIGCVYVERSLAALSNGLLEAHFSHADGLLRPSVLSSKLGLPGEPPA